MDQRLPLPVGICIECQHRGSALTHPSGRIAMYCPHGQAGAVLRSLPSGGHLWTIYTPITREDFTDALADFSLAFRELVAAQDAGGPQIPPVTGD